MVDLSSLGGRVAGGCTFSECEMWLQCIGKWEGAAAWEGGAAWEEAVECGLTSRLGQP